MTSELVARGRMKAPALKTRKPTALPVWPLALAAAIQGGGKSYSAMEAANSPLIGHTFAMEIGEASLDPYGAMVNLEHFDLLEHDGTYASIAEQLWAAVEQPRVDPDKPNLIIVDGASGLWDLLVNENQIIANARARKYNRPIGPDGADISPDLWNAAKRKWLAVMGLLQSHDGPVIITGRLNEVAVFDGKAPAKDGSKEWKVEAHKSLAFDVDVVLEARKVRRWEATKTRSLTFQIEEGQTRPIPGFTFDKLWRAMGIVEGTQTARRQITAQNAEAGANEAMATEGGALSADQWKAQIAGAEQVETVYAMHARAKAAGQLDLDIDGTVLNERLRLRAMELKKANAGDQTAVDTAAAEKRAEGDNRVGAVVAAAQGRRLETPDAPAAAEQPQLPESDPEAEAEALAAEAEQRAMLRDELAMIAEITGLPGPRLIAKKLPEGIDAAPTEKLQATVAGLRLLAINKLRETGRVAEAEAYAKVGETEYDIPSGLLGQVDKAA